MRKILSLPRLALALAMTLTLAVAAPAMAAQKDESAPTPTRETARQELRGNAQSRIYHNAGCKYYTCKACTVRLSTPAEARAKGFRACKVCGG